MLLLYLIFMLTNNHTWGSSKADVEHYEQHEVTQQEQFEYYYAQGDLFHKKENSSKAFFWFFKAFEIAPKNIVVLLRITDIYLEQQQIDQATAFMKNRIEEDPDNVILVEKLATIYLDNGQQEKAYHLCKRAIELNSSDWKIYAYLIKHDFPNKINEQTLSLSLRSIELYPEKLSPYYNTGLILEYLNRPAEAIPYFKKALEIDPSHEPSHRVLSKSYFKTGQMLKAWWHQQWREKLRPHEDLCIEDFKGKRVALIPEAELGDMIQFVRFAACLKGAGAQEVWIYTYEPLMDIFTSCPFIDRVLSYHMHVKAPLLNKFMYNLYMGKADIELRLQSLPLLFQTTLETIPCSDGYLYADEKLVTKWKEHLSNDTNFKIGICWATNNMFIENNPWTKRSIHLNSFFPVAELENVSIYSLQQYNGVSQLDELKDRFILHTFDNDFDKTNGRFMDTAAVMKNLNLIITVDTSIAHLAGALGVPVWVLLPYNNEYRWMQDRTDTPWYTTMRLFRCKQPEGWNDVMQEVKVALNEQIYGTLDNGQIMNNMHIEPIQLHQVEDVKHIILTVAFSLWPQPNQITFDKFKNIWESAQEFDDIDRIQSTYITNNGLFLVLLDGDRVVGSGAVKKITNDICEFTRFWFLSKYQGKGWGLIMANQLLAFAKQQGYKKICLNICYPEIQVAAIALYKKLGFVETAPYTGYAALVMEKIL